MAAAAAAGARAATAATPGANRQRRRRRFDFGAFRSALYGWSPVAAAANAAAAAATNSDPAAAPAAGLYLHKERRVVGDDKTQPQSIKFESRRYQLPYWGNARGFRMNIRI